MVRHGILNRMTARKTSPMAARMTSENIRRLEIRAKSTDRDEGGEDRGGNGTVIERKTKTQSKTKRPPMFKVILLNDDYTPMEFVVELLKSVFHKPHAEATKIMLWVHQNGMGVAGVFPFEIAETKVHNVEELA